MGYKEDILKDGSRGVVFLYKLTPGITTESFGIECGRLAGLPEPLLKLAASKSKSLRQSVEAREKRNRYVINYFLQLDGSLMYILLQILDGDEIIARLSRHKRRSCGGRVERHGEGLGHQLASAATFVFFFLGFCGFSEGASTSSAFRLAFDLEDFSLRGVASPDIFASPLRGSEARVVSRTCLHIACSPVACPYFSEFISCCNNPSHASDIHSNPASLSFLKNRFVWRIAVRTNLKTSFICVVVSSPEVAEVVSKVLVVS